MVPSGERDFDTPAYSELYQTPLSPVEKGGWGIEVEDVSPAEKGAGGEVRGCKKILYAAISFAFKRLFTSKTNMNPYCYICPHNLLA